MHRPGSQQQQMTQPCLQHSELSWHIFVMKNLKILAFKTKIHSRSSNKPCKETSSDSNKNIICISAVCKESLIMFQ